MMLAACSNIVKWFTLKVSNHRNLKVEVYSNKLVPTIVNSTSRG